MYHKSSVFITLLHMVTISYLLMALWDSNICFSVLILVAISYMCYRNLYQNCIDRTILIYIFLWTYHQPIGEVLYFVKISFSYAYTIHLQLSLMAIQIQFYEKSCVYEIQTRGNSY